MQIESRIVVPFKDEAISQSADFSRTEDQLDFVQSVSAPPADKPRESKVDVVSAAVIYGLTGAFVAFLFGWVTEYMRLLDNFLLSSFMGVCVGVIAFALMKEEE